MADFFTIVEMQSDGSGSYSPKPDGDAFAWYSGDIPLDLAGVGKGGARAVPYGPLKRGGQLRRVRTDYPGLVEPTEQILGPSHKDHTYSGRWDDRYNFGGYAFNERRRFEDMVRRAPVVQIAFQSLIYIGIIFDWDFEDHTKSDIGYTFSVSVHTKSSNKVENRAPEDIKSPGEVVERAEIAKFALDEVADIAPKGALGGTLLSDVSSQLDRATAFLDDLSSVVDNRDRAPGLKTLGQFKRIASQLRAVGGAASSVVDSLVGVRSDIDVTIRTAMSVLDFEEWHRGVCIQSRLLRHESLKGAIAMEERDSPSIEETYEPYKGESLYSVSRRFYGTPHAWRLIADRNNLQTMTLTGEERLLIPERAAE